MSASELQRGSPYQGLIPYDEADAPFFFGREKEARLIIANLFASPLTLLYGASGVGKSSVLRAGVAHQLRAREDLLVVVFNAWQSNPVSDLKQAVADFADLADHDAWRQAMRLLPQDRPASLAEFLTICATQLNRRLMIILDQFEEYFLYHPQEDEFASEFSRAVTQSGAPVSFLISIREDFYAKLDRFEGRIPTLYDNYLRIEHLDRKAARVAIEKPIIEYNRHYTTDGQFSIDPKLVDAVLRQVETGRVIIGEAGRGVVETAGSAEEGAARIETPFLQLVMTRLWEKELGAGSHKLRLETLDKLGGAGNIVRTHLDAVITRLSAREQEIAAGIFHYLVTPSGTKIAYTASDLAGSAELNEAEVVRVLERLSHGDVRILRTVEPSPDRPTAPRYEIFHDVLAPAILTWRTAYVQMQERADAERRAEEQEQRADEQAKVASRFRRLAIALAAVIVLALGAAVLAVAQTVRAKANAARADNYARESERLRQEGQRDKALAQAERERAESQTRLAVKLKSDADAAQKVAEDERRKTEEQIKIAEQRKAEAEKAQDVARLKTLAAAAANVAAGKASEAAAEQASATRVAFSNLLSVQSKTLLNERPQLSTLLAIEALRATQKDDPPTPAAEEALRQSLAQFGGRVFSGPWDRDEGWSVKDVTMSPDGRWLASASDTVVRLFDLNAPNANAPARIFNEAGAPIVFSPDGHWLIAAGKTARDDTPEQRTRRTHVLLWNLTDRTANSQPTILTGSSPHADGITISPDSRWLVVTTVEAGDSPRLWDLKSSERAAKSLPIGEFNLITLAISPDSRWLVTSVGKVSGGYLTTTPNAARLWNLNEADPTAKPLELRGHKFAVAEAVFSPDGRWLATSSALCDDGVRLWDVKTPDPAAKPITLGHKGAIGAIAFSPDSRWLVTGGGRTTFCQSDFIPHLWDLTLPDIAAKPIRLPTHEGPIFAAAFSAENSLLVTVAGQGYSVVPRFAFGETKGMRRLGDAEGAATGHAWILGAVVAGELEREDSPHIIMRDPENAAQNFAVSPDNRWLLAKSENRAVLWNLTSAGVGINQPPIVLRGHDGGLSAVAFSADSRRLVTGSFDETARLWNLSDYPFAMPLSLPNLAYESPIVQSADRRLLAVTTTERAPPGTAEDSPESYDRAGAVALVSDLTANDPSKPLVLRGHKRKIKSAAFSADNRWLVTGSNDKTARLWDLADANPAAHPLVFAGHKGSVDDVAISADKHWLATAGHDGVTRLWDLTAANPTARPFLLSTFESPVLEGYQYTNHVYISSDSRWLVTSGHYYQRAPAALWDLKAPDPSASFTKLGMIDTEDVAFSPDGRWLLVFRNLGDQNESQSNSARLWDLTRKSPAAPFVLTGDPKKPIYREAFSSDGRWLFTSSFEKAIRRWNLTASDPSVAPLLLRSPLNEPSESLGGFSLSPDNRWLVADSLRATHILWDLAANDPNTARYLLKNPDGSGRAQVAFAPDSRWLVTSYEKTLSEVVRILSKRDLSPSATHNHRWDLTAADPSAMPVALPGRVLISKNAVSPDGRWLITRGVGRATLRDSIDLWNMRLDDLIDLACRTAGRNLSEKEEWKTYFPGQTYRKTCGDLPARE